MSYLSRSEREGYAALNRAKEMNHVMLLDERWPVVGTCYRCQCGASVTIIAQFPDRTWPVDLRADLRHAPVVHRRHRGVHSTQDDLDELFGPDREP